MTTATLGVDPWEDRDDLRLQQYLHSIGLFQPLTADEEAALARRLRNGDREALDSLVNANLRHVVEIARVVAPHGLSCLDLVAEGTVGLVRAAASFDERGGFRFLTCARWWIMQSIQKALDERAPAERAAKLRSLNARAGSKNAPVPTRRAADQERDVE